MTLNANVTSRGTGTITLNAGDSISQTNSYVVQITGGAGTIIATADTEGNGGGGFTQSDGASFDSGGGAITVSAYDDVDLSLLDAGATGTVSVTSTNGGITDNTSAENANVIGASIVFAAETGIGASDIETAATTISAATTNGDVDIHNTHASDVTVTSLWTGMGDILFSQDGGGDLTVTNAHTTDGGIWIDATEGIQLNGYIEATDIIDIRAGAELLAFNSATIRDGNKIHARCFRTN